MKQRHISSHHLEQLLRTAFDIGRDNQCPYCGTRMVSTGQHSPECPPNRITLEVECPQCRSMYPSSYGFRAIMTNHLKVVLEAY